MGSHLPKSAKNNIAWGAWVSPGAYAKDLDHALANEENWADAHTPANSHPGGSITPNWPSEPYALSADASNFNNAGEAISNNSSFSAPDWAAFQQDVVALETDCGYSV